MTGQARQREGMAARIRVRVRTLPVGRVLGDRNDLDEDLVVGDAWDWDLLHTSRLPGLGDQRLHSLRYGHVRSRSR